MSGKLLKMAQPVPKGDANLSSVLIVIGKNRETKQRELLLTKRTLLVETHKGHVSFPGGYWESDDKDLLHTALRESAEEIGTRPEDIRILGALEPVRTRDDITIYPFVGELDLPYQFQINPHEVDRLLFLSVGELLEKRLCPVQIDLGEFKVASRGIYVDNELVWGATAKILENLLEYLEDLVIE